MSPEHPLSNEFRALVAANSPYWGAEAEVVRTYFTSPKRTTQTDLLWVWRQMYKELWDGVFLSLENLKTGFARLGNRQARKDFLDETYVLRDETVHYHRFALIHDFLTKETSSPDIDRLRETGCWEENTGLMKIRDQHRAEYGQLGIRAARFTEGGYCTLYSEGLKLRGSGELGELIADACQVVYEDEFLHMLRGITGIDKERMTPDDWSLLTEITVTQSRYRIAMRNAQFSSPVPPARLAELSSGHGTPIAFDFDKAATLIF